MFEHLSGLLSVVTLCVLCSHMEDKRSHKNKTKKRGKKEEEGATQSANQEENIYSSWFSDIYTLPDLQTR